MIPHEQPLNMKNFLYAFYQNHNHYRKWLQYYLDFYQEYNLHSIRPESFQKLYEKMLHFLNIFYIRII